MDLPLPLRTLLCFLAVVFAINTTAGAVKAPAKINAEETEKLILIDRTTLKAVPTLPLKFATMGILVGWANESYLYDLISRYDWNFDEAYAIMTGESKGNPNAINKNDYHKTGNCWGSYGLFQLACFRGTPEELLDPETNVRMAYELWQKEGWKPWGVYNDKSYKLYLES